MYSEYYEEAVSEFSSDRLQSYYSSHTDLAQPAFALLDEARMVAAHSPSAAVVMATAAIEVTLKTMFLRPLVSGLVHSAAASDLVAELVVGQMGLDRIKNLLAHVLSETANVDLYQDKVPGSSSSIWEEIRATTAARNGVVHRGVMVTSAEAEIGLTVATHILENMFPKVIDGLGLQLRERAIVGT